MMRTAGLILGPLHQHATHRLLSHHSHGLLLRMTHSHHHLLLLLLLLQLLLLLYLHTLLHHLLLMEGAGHGDSRAHLGPTGSRSSLHMYHALARPMLLRRLATWHHGLLLLLL
jgi:hypothetical protein